MLSRLFALRRRSLLRAHLGAGVCGALVACSDSAVAPKPTTPHPAYLASGITCVYTGSQGTVVCAQYAHAYARTLASALAALRGQAAPTLIPGVTKPTGVQRSPIGLRQVYFGQQGIDVYIATDNVVLNGNLLSFQATVQNLSTEPLGTSDGRTPDPDSIMVFFNELPVVTSGTGTVAVDSVTGYNTFTAANQPYYEYPGLLPSNATSPPVEWVFQSTGQVQNFDFAVYVAAAVPDTSSSALSIPPHAFDSLAVGQAHTCAIRPGNHEYCWGFNAYGALGVGESAPVPTAIGVLGNLSIESVAAGNEFSCALAVGGAYCWGDNLSGEVGDGTETDRGEPVLTSPPQGSFSDIESGTDFACGIVSGAGYCWGDNYAGQLGTGASSLTLEPTPQEVMNSPQLVSVTTGAFHACGLTSGGTAYCWGANADGELGTGNFTFAGAPTAVNGNITFSSLVAGTNFTCGLNTVGAAYCWGANVYGSLGTGSVGGNSNVPVAVGGGQQFARLAAGAYHACGVTSSGSAYCWGSNVSGQIGDGTTTDRATPVQVVTTNAFTDIGAGFGHTCALTATGATYCWGDNSSGQIGDGTFNQRLSPTAVLLP